MSDSWNEEKVENKTKVIDKRIKKNEVELSVVRNRNVKEENIEGQRPIISRSRRSLGRRLKRRKRQKSRGDDSDCDEEDKKEEEGEEVGDNDGDKVEKQEADEEED